MTAPVNASTSSGLRLVTILPSVTTASSTTFAPAFLRSVRIEGQLVAVRSRSRSASISSHGPWQIAATGGDRLPLLPEAPDQRDDVAVKAKLVRVAHAAGKDQRVEIVSVRLLDGDVRPDRLPRIVVHGRLDRVARERGEHDFGSALLKDLARPEQLPFLEAVGRNDQHSRVGNLHREELLWARNSRALSLA